MIWRWRLRMTKNKIKSYRIGCLAEYVAAFFMMLKGYRILVMRYKTPVGEIDVLARRGGTLVAVEVKARKAEREGLEAVHSKNRARVEQAFKHFVMKNPEYQNYDFRFDVIVYSPPFSIRHLDNAWLARS